MIAVMLHMGLNLNSLLQRSKASHVNLQVLFCKLCKDQRDMYRAYLNSQEVDAIFAGNRQALAGIDILRKICNHPDLLERTKWEGSEEYGKPEKSGKLMVLMKVLYDRASVPVLHSSIDINHIEPVSSMQTTEAAMPSCVTLAGIAVVCIAFLTINRQASKLRHTDEAARLPSSANSMSIWHYLNFSVASFSYKQ